jgi:hypothetical protein
MFQHRTLAGAFALALTLLSFSAPAPLHAQASPTAPPGEQYGERLDTVPGVRLTTAEIMRRQKAMPQMLIRWHPHFEREVERDDLADNPEAPATSTWPPNAAKFSGSIRPLAAQTTALSFDGANSDDTQATPPDSMGTIGPNQYIVFVNGRLRSFDKTGAADGVLNANPDVFFASVMTPVGGSVVLNFTSDPQIRYDRFTARWYLSIIDVPCTDANCNGTAANRWLLAVSDAASNGTITASTVWTFFQVKTDNTNFCDYPSLGIDVNALYFGCNMFSPTAFAGTNGYVVQKSSVQGAGPMVVTKFTPLATAGGAGPFAPRGVDNFDPGATVGYFVGADNNQFSRITFRRVSNPGSATPSISGNIRVTVPTTGATNPVEHQGNTGGNNGRLDSLDDRLFAAMIRNGHLWTAHNLRVDASGVQNTGSAARKASRWYDFTMSNSANPTLTQSGTIYDSAGTLNAAAQFWIPSMAATGQGHAVIGFSKAGNNYGATPSYTGRLSGDALGTMAGVPGASMTDIGVTAASYNPSWDSGGTSGRRWGDYSFTAVDPLDDMTVWTIQEYNEATDMYAVRVAKLLAPPPATPTCSATPVDFPSGTGNVTITGTSTGGSGFYDPGTDLPSPALPFTHIGASMTNATVNSVTYNSPTQVTLNITASTLGLQDVTIVNPDGQSTTASGCINVTLPLAAKLAFTTQPPSGSVSGSVFSATVSVEDAGGNVVTTDNSNVTIALAGGTLGANLGGILTVQAVNGVATFSGLSVDKAGTGYSLHATDASLTAADSSAFAIVAGTAANIAFTQQPVDTTAGATNAGASSGGIVATVTDGAGNPVAGESVALGVASGPAAAFTSITSPQTTDASGNATFADAVLTVAGTYTLGAADGALGATSNSFNIAAASPDHLAFTPVPGDIMQGQTLGSVTVTEYDAFDNPVVADNTTQVSLTAGSCGGTVLGTATLSGGVGQFNTTPSFMTVASGVSLSAAAGTVPPTAASSTFNVASNTDIIFAGGFDDCRP